MTDGIVVFAYNFCHKKTEDFLVRLFLEGINVRLVVAADPVRLGVEPHSVRTKVKRVSTLQPKDIARRLGFDYVVEPHDGDRCLAILDDLQPAIGVVAGARILKEAVIDRFSKGIVNFHPGLIPEIRGLDALLWAIYKNEKIGVTAHLIDRRVDAGTLIFKEEIDLALDDTLFDLSEKLYDKQLEMLSPSLAAVRSRDRSEFTQVLAGVGPPNRKMPPELEQRVVELLPGYLAKMAGGRASASS